MKHPMKRRQPDKQAQEWAQYHIDCKRELIELDGISDIQRGNTVMGFGEITDADACGPLISPPLEEGEFTAD